ncbi:indole-3-pyruvate decarboxylase [Yersinia aldovae]|uniref:alpha-keto acid decarboxylase family protein n=1 Tax=Yersinia aldovae TaxID=29483 RepID=UPI0005E56502|nr:thiamine pyrophosphate-dependent enzyme [Yersinia aldovae]CNH95964.1 indole-3-pyruvate decarboxylase [Yersinia aldovae]
MAKTVVQHVLSRLYDLGISDIFGVPGDFAFPIQDAVCEDSRLRWIGNCNELNAAYAADGYARIRGMAALNTTFAVGELSALNGVAGAFAESLPVFHLVGMPSSTVQASGVIVHHTLGDGNFTAFYETTKHFVCAHAIMTPENCVAETERLIAAALRYRKPVYMGFPSDYAEMPIIESDVPQTTPAQSNPAALSLAVEAIADRMNRSQKTCILPGISIARHNLRQEALELVNSTNLPFATMFMDKSVLDESHPNYIGIYNGHLLNDDVSEFVEGCDCILKIGAMLSDFNTGAFTADFSRADTLNIEPEFVQIGETRYNNVMMQDVLTSLVGKVARRTETTSMPHATAIPLVSETGKITADYLYSRWQEMLKPDDILVAETGTVSMGMGFALLPQGATFHNQTLWGSIGWATPAALGAAIAAPEKRTILVTGEGSHQLTAQEISQFHRYGLKPTIIVLNNDGYLIERLLCKDSDIYYNDLAQWKYSKLPEAMGCEGWFSIRVTTCKELNDAIEYAETCNCGVYIEVVTEKYVTSALAAKLHDSIDTLYSM